MSVPKYATDYPDSRRLDGTQQRSRKVGRAELGTTHPGTEERRKPEFYEKPRINQDKQRVIQDKSRVIQDKSRVIKDKPRTIQDKQRVIQDKPRAIQDKPRVIKDKSPAIQDKPRVIQDTPRPVHDNSRAFLEKQRVGTDKYRAEHDKSRVLRSEDVKNKSNRERDEKPVKSPEVDHRIRSNRIRLKKDSSSESYDNSTKQHSESRQRKISDEVDCKSTTKSSRRVLPSTPASTIKFYEREDSEKSLKPLPKHRPETAHVHYEPHVHGRSDSSQLKSNKPNKSTTKSYESKPKTDSITKRSSRDEEIPLKDLGSPKRRDGTPGRAGICRTDGHKRPDGTGATVTFQMQDNDRHKDTDTSRIAHTGRGHFHTDSAYDKTDIKLDLQKTKHGYHPGGSSTVHKHYLSPDGHPSMVEKSKSQHRLQNQSSTETSGLGETITSGFSSQESIASHYSGSRAADTGPNSCHDQGIDLTEDTRSINEHTYSAFETKSIDPSRGYSSTNEVLRSNAKTVSPVKTNSISKGNNQCINKDSQNRKRKASEHKNFAQQMLEGFKPREVFLGPTDQSQNNRGANRPTVPFTIPPTSKPRTLNLGGHNAGPNFDELFMQSQTLPVPHSTMGLQVEQINNEWNKHNRASSVKSRSSHGSFRSRSGSTRRSRRFLAGMESRWMKWGRERRASFRRRQEKIEKPEPELPPRASTPVKKARQEGLMFIHPDLESKYISEEDINYIQRHRQERLKTYKVIEKAKKIPYHAEHHELNRLTVNELNILTRFWEHRVFVRSRYVSILLSLATIFIYVISICSSQWISYPSLEVLASDTSMDSSRSSNAKTVSPVKTNSISKGNNQCINKDSQNRKRKASEHKNFAQQMLEGFKPREVFLGPTDQSQNNRGANRPTVPFTIPPTSKPRTLNLGGHNAGPNFDELFMQSQTLPVPHSTMGLQVEQINNEWNKHNRASSVKSRSSHGSFRSRSGSTRRSRRFLAGMESRWMKWGRERRASFRRRQEKIEKPEPELPPRASTPVKKARQEGLMFIHPDLESKYISEEDINYIQRHRQERLKTYKVIEKAKKIPYHAEHHELNRLTVNELNILTRFWEHRVFVRSRYVSILLSLATIFIYVISICSSQWISYPSLEDMNRNAHEGLWFKCRPVFGSRDQESCDESAHRDKLEHQTWSSLWSHKCQHVENSTEPQCLDSYSHWQNAVIGLMIFSAAFGFVAAVLAICGVCTSPLPKKIYYFHSAGEIFFVCALSTTIALIIYPIAIAMDDNIQSHTYGSGYGLGWGGTAFYFAAALCMSLDELVRESSQNKCCRFLCWRSRTNDRGEHPV